MRSILFIILSALFTTIGSSQDVREARLSVADQSRFALNIQFPFEQKILDEAWSQKAKDINIKGKNNKGILTYEKVIVYDIHFEPITLYVKVEKAEKTSSQISIAIAKENGEFITENDDKIAGNLRSFLTNFSTYCDQYKLKLDIKTLDDDLKKAQKEQERLVEDGKKLQQQIEKNKVDQENKTKEIQSMQSGLEQLRQRLK